jgi:hypothetical protein
MTPILLYLGCVWWSEKWDGVIPSIRDEFIPYGVWMEGWGRTRAYSHPDEWDYHSMFVVLWPSCHCCLFLNDPCSWANNVSTSAASLLVAHSSLVSTSRRHGTTMVAALLLKAAEAAPMRDMRVGLTLNMTLWRSSRRHEKWIGPAHKAARPWAVPEPRAVTLLCLLGNKPRDSIPRVLPSNECRQPERVPPQQRSVSGLCQRPSQLTVKAEGEEKHRPRVDELVQHLKEYSHP